VYPGCVPASPRPPYCLGSAGKVEGHPPAKAAVQVQSNESIRTLYGAYRGRCPQSVYSEGSYIFGRPVAIWQCKLKLRLTVSSQHLRQPTRPGRLLQVRGAAQMLALDEEVGDGALLGEGVQRFLHRRPVRSRVQVERVERNPPCLQHPLGPGTIATIRFGKHLCGRVIARELWVTGVSMGGAPR
jgi:hypothetical protein